MGMEAPKASDTIQVVSPPKDTQESTWFTRFVVSVLRGRKSIEAVFLALLIVTLIIMSIIAFSRGRMSFHEAFSSNAPTRQNRDAQDILADWPTLIPLAVSLWMIYDAWRRRPDPRDLLFELGMSGGGQISGWAILRRFATLKAQKLAEELVHEVGHHDIAMDFNNAAQLIRWASWRASRLWNRRPFVDRAARRH
jgi:hypothetical protein